MADTLERKFAVMADYDFCSLSGYDFALLSRDLVQADRKLFLESFSAGPDSGIDFPYQDGTNKIIVQCKHYGGSGFSALASVLRRKERPKIDLLSPTQYILTTSVSLTPDRKQQIMEILAPHCIEPSDVLGRGDLNNLLSHHEEIEHQHFKLWLTSETVLRRVMDAGIFADSEAHLDRVRLRLRRYVENPSFDRARKILTQSHYCIIAGIPGIGKTTLAEVLLADLVDRQGFEAFRIAHDLAEIRPVKNSKRKQVFYFDDFLGKTALEKLQKNEDQRLVELMEEAAGNENWRFILTTREYILNRAKLHYEAFSQPSVDFRLCTINLGDYTRQIRARILYNHIYFSDLPVEYKRALLWNFAYDRILNHRNYNPRVIEYMTQARHACAVAPSLYVREFADSLEHPARIWDHAFRHQISEASRHVLLVLGTLPENVLLKDLEAAFWTFYSFRRVRFGFATNSGDWNDALKQLDGSFLATRCEGEDIIVSFHNPSIRDFIEDFLSDSEEDVADLISGAHFYEQFTTLWTGQRGRRYRGVDRHADEFLRKFGTKIFGPSARIVRTVNTAGEVVGYSSWQVSNEGRAEFALRVANELKSEAANQFLAAVVAGLEKLWHAGHADREDLVRLVRALTDRGLTRSDSAFLAAQRCLSTNIEEREHFRAIAEFFQAYPGAISSTALDQIRAQFLSFADDYSRGWDGDPEWYRGVAGDLEFVGERFALDVTKYTERLYRMADEAESEGAGGSPEGYEDREWGRSSASPDDVHDMFTALRAELDG